MELASKVGPTGECLPSWTFYSDFGLLSISGCLMFWVAFLLRPARKGKGMHIWSFDLTSRTGCMLIGMLVSVLEALFGSEFALAIWLVKQDFNIATCFHQVRKKCHNSNFNSKTFS